MNLDKLRDAEGLFMQRYPGGFENEELKQMVAKRHNVGKLSEFAAEALKKSKFAMPAQVMEDIVKVVTRSSMVSMFEKPKYRDYINGMTRDDREYLAGCYKRLLHGRSSKAFEDIVDVLAEAKLAKWSLMTIHLHHFRPDKDVFVKPTTTKNVIRQFEIEDLEYKPRPSWAFYERYRDVITQMKAHVDPGLAPNNAAFTGFLMMTTGVR